VAVSGSYAYVVGGQGHGLRVIDVSTPESPFEAGSFDALGDAWGVAVSGSHAYVADQWEGLWVVDVSTPASPIEVGFFDTPGDAWGVAVSGRYVYVADGDAGMEVFLKCGVMIFSDGLESGDTSAWSATVP
jgi:hypothetical protein